MHTFNRPVFELIGEYESGGITAIYGNAASGKTTICLLAALSCTSAGGKVIFIDTENSFNTDRLKQLYFGDINKIMDKIFLMQPKTFEEQNSAILDAKKLCEKESIKLVIVDTIGNHYRNKVNENHKEVNTLMAEHMAELIRIARDMNKIVLITNQVSSKVEGNDEVKMVGGKFIEKMAKIIIELKNDDEKRYAKLIKFKVEEEEKPNPNLNKKIWFKIKEKGLFLV